MSAEVIIRKQRIRITVPDEKLAFESRQFVNETLLSDINQVYEHVFFESVSSTAYLILDKLKVDLGTISAHDFKSRIPGLLEKKLLGEIQDQFNSNAVANEYESTDVPSAGATGNPDPLRYRTENQQNTDALILFLQTGRFPWWYSGRHGTTPAALLDSLSDAEWRNFLASLVAQMSKERDNPVLKNIIHRLYIHLHESHYETCLVALSTLFANGGLAKNVDTLIMEKDGLTKLFSMTKRDFHVQLAINILLNHDQPNFVKSFLAHLQQSFPLTREQMTQHFKEQAISGIPVEAFETSKIEYPSTESTGRKSPEPTDSIYVFNAGLVILHPFLPAFFKALGLLDEENNFISRETQRRAAVLLYYLQCGKADYKEWEMPLNKILCGLELEDLIPDHIELSDLEIEESISLLNSIIEYWTALRGCSIEALKSTFLMREGKLTLKENSWLIQIERSGVDILVDRLPWGIGTIKLPWHKELISVEW
jgi:hypothetical protein